MPSSVQVRLVILKASEQADDGAVVDLGSGWGTLLFAMAKKYPDRQLIGYELSWLPWAYSRIVVAMCGMQHVRIYRSSFLDADFSNSSLLLCYLHPEGMQVLQQKLLDDQPVRALLVSSTFAFSDVAPVHTIRVDDLYQTPVYVYRFKKKRAVGVQHKE
ncbi:MAG: methyltransferase [Mariprofundus sp.]|nr:methyltransferase [Mariprofundus sp.]